MKHNPNKTICASAQGILISFRESNKYQFLEYREKFQPEHKPKYQEISKPVFNKLQQTLYAKTVYGLSYYTSSELKKMPKSKLKQLEEQHIRIQETLNRWKTEVMHSKLDSILLALFPKSPIVKTITGIRPEGKLTSTKSFKELGIDQVQIAHKLIGEGFLPENFFQLGV